MSDRDEERLARIALSQLTEPGDPKLIRTAASVGVVELYEHLRGERDLFGMREDAAVRLADIHPERDMERADARGIRFVIPGDAEWPTRLDALAECGGQAGREGVPLGLWVQGPLRLDQVAHSVAVVGSRSATSYGAEVAIEIGATVAEAGTCVVSGAAFGIDQAAHRGALAAEGPTIAVMANGLDRVYPAAHTNLVRYIAEHGLVVSELALGCTVTRWRLLARNRIIAALGAGTVVVEAALRSGALSTANWTQSLSRPVMAVPGPVTSEPSAGCHQLIRSGAASLVTCGGEVLELTGASGDHLMAEPRGEERPRDRLNLRQAQVLDAVPAAQEAPTESIARAAGMSLRSVLALLEELYDLEFVVRGENGWQLSALARSA
ncbi:DNA-processing protein DprA [Nocardioides sp. AE5]|uniref:DNA-processing protein DprA n=1 Tax=Nocardioides sp. AE5 TaxID=2962573 RepID=UPI002880BE22|nr:DNA-processing protein DprA [Nocardioides sp. AE5]MDT0203268.1 DNA-processing protein DprA [Nocardioides sp. AE5]